MARKRAMPNLIYGTIGLAAVGAAGYFTYRFLQRRRAEGEDTMMALRRSTREAGRVVKDTVQKVGKDAKRGVTDAGASLEDASSSGKQLLTQATKPGNTSYNRI